MKKIIYVTTLILGMVLNAQVPEKAEDISPLLIGEQLPNVTLKGIDGKEKELKKILKEKPSVLIFYRGGWCPYCNTQLSSLMDIEKQVQDLGYQIVAITPENQQNLKATMDNTKIDYKLFSDEKGELIEKIGIAFKTGEKTKKYASKKSKGEISTSLPVPTVMIVDKKGNILYEYINPNYSVRLSGSMLLAVLKNIVGVDE